MVAPIVAGSGSASAQTTEGEPASIVFWSREGNPERVARTQKNIEAFTEKTGIEVELVVVDETAQFTLILVNAAAGTLPDVVHHPAALTSRWVKAGNSERRCVGRGARGAGRGDLLSGLARRRWRSTASMRPSRSMGRGPWCTTARDLFEEAGLAPPRTYDEMLAAAAALHDPDNQRYGIGLSTDPGNEAMQTRLESMALANGCNLVDSAGEADFDSPNCLEFLEFEQKLRQYAPEGLFDSVASRALYLSGQAAMYIGGTATLHRMAGLDDSQLATCAECTENPAYLAENTSFDSGLVRTERRAGSARRAHDRRHLGGRGRRARAGVRPLSADRRVHRMARAGAEHPPAGTSRYGGGSRALPQGVAQAGDGRRAQRASSTTSTRLSVVDELLEGAPKKFDSWALRQPALTGAVYESLLVPQVVAEMHEGAPHARGSRRTDQRGARPSSSKISTVSAETDRDDVHELASRVVPVRSTSASHDEKSSNALSSLRARSRSQRSLRRASRLCPARSGRLRDGVPHRAADRLEPGDRGSARDPPRPSQR